MKLINFQRRIALLSFLFFLVILFVIISQEKRPIIAGVVPHHLVADDLIEDFFKKLRKNAPGLRTIVIIGPDHFSRIPAPVITGKITYPDERIFNLLRGLGVQISSSDIQREHAIINLIPFIQKNFPQASVVPILHSEDVSISFLNNIAKVLASETSDDVVFLASSDFSHHLHENATLFHDLRSIDVFSSFDERAFSDLETDLWQSLYLVRKIAALKGADDFELMAHRNTSHYYDEILHDNVGYVTGFFRKGEAKKNYHAATLLFFGDMMFDRGIAERMQNDIYFPFKKIHHLMLGVDLVSGNLEGPIVKKRPFGNYENRFAFQPKIAEILRSMDIDVVNLANNHIFDASEIGIDETKKHLETARVSFTPFETVVRGDSIALLGYSPFLPNFDVDTIMQEIEEYSKRNAFTAVQVHWGDEYATIANESQRSLGQAMIDHGADLIIGHGPHVVQPYELYKEKPIFYSVGNFIFDQGGTPELEEGWAVGVSLETDEIRYFIFPLQLSGYQPKMLYGSPKSAIFTVSR